jgi:2-methylcitrate dehydratase PrpD
VTLLERLGAHAVGAYREGLPGSPREAARLHLADTVGAWIAAGGTAEGRALLRFESAERESLSGRVELAGALARLSEVDDIHLASATTPGAIVVPAALMLASSLDRNGSALAEAIAVGYDAMTRLGAALNGPAILYRGVWPTYLTAPFAVAAVVARLLQLTEKQAGHALAIALSLSSPAVGRQSGATMSRWLAVGNAVRNGLTAAVSAQNGFTGDLHLFEGDFFSSVYALTPDPSVLLDERPALNEVSFKPWCAARQTMAATQALKEIIESGASPSEMSELVVSVPPPTLRMIDHGVVPRDRASHLTSVSYQMAMAALAPEATLDIGQAPDGTAVGIQTFMAKISVKADEELLRHYPKSWPARLVVSLPSGRSERLVLHVPGDPERPFDELQVAEKFRRLTAPLVGERAAHDLLHLSLGVLDKKGAPKILLAEIERAVAAAGASR